MKYPSDTELADLTGYTIARIKQLKGLDISCVSIDEPSGGDADGTLLEMSRKAGLAEYLRN